MQSFSEDVIPVEAKREGYGGADIQGEVSHDIVGERSNGYMGVFDDYQQKYSDNVHLLANKIDSFFGGDRIYEESKDSLIKVNVGALIEEGGKISIVQGLNAKIVLPKSQERLNLLISGDSESTNRERAVSDSTSTGQTRNDLPSGNTESVELRYLMKRTREFYISASGGIEIDFTPDFYTKLRGRRSFISGEWETRLTELIFWYKSIGLGEETSIEFERFLPGQRLFRSSSSATWYDDTDDFFLKHEFTFFQKHYKREYIAWQAGLEGTSEPVTHATNYYLGFKFRRNVHKNWFFFEVNPVAEYPKDNDFRLTPSLLLKVEAIFGKL